MPLRAANGQVGEGNGGPTFDGSQVEACHVAQESRGRHVKQTQAGRPRSAGVSGQGLWRPGPDCARRGTSAAVKPKGFRGVGVGRGTRQRQRVPSGALQPRGCETPVLPPDKGNSGTLALRVPRQEPSCPALGPAPALALSCSQGQCVGAQSPACRPRRPRLCGPAHTVSAA